MISWMPDTCQCVLEIKLDGNNVNFIGWIQKCQIHKNFNNQALVVQILLHNRGFGISLNASLREKQENILNKRNEKARIRAMGDPEKNV